MWNDLTMRERADLIRQGVALGYKDIDSIRNNYHIFGKGSTLNSSYQDPNPYYNRLSDNDKKIWRNLAAQRQKFDQMMQQYSPQIYNDPQLRNTMEYIAFHENKWNNVGVSSQGARGHFQLMPDTIATARAQAGRNFDVRNPSDDFAMMQITALNSMKNIDRLLKDPEFRRKAQERNYDKYDLLMSSWLSGPGGMEKNIRNSKYNPKDAYGTSIGKYVGDTGGYTKFSNPMIVNTGPEGKVVTISTPEDVARQLAEEEQAQSQTYSQGAYQEEQPQEQIDTPVSDTFLKDQYERLVEQNAELSQADQEMKEKWNQMMENVQAEQERQNIVSMINTLGWQKAQPITPVQGQITNDERVYNNPVLAAQMYNRRNNRISNGSFGKYFFNGQEDNIPMVLGYNPYSPVIAFGGPIHRYDYAGTVNTPYSNNNPEQKRIHYQWYNNPRHQQLMEERLKGVSPLDDPDAPAQPIQSHYQVNPVYWGNTTVQGEPVNITGYKDNKTGIAQYQDGEYGYVNLPENYGMYMMDGITVTPERSALRNLVQDYVTQENDTLISPLLGAGDSEIQPIKFSDASAEPYKAQDLDRFFANLITGGLAGTEEEAARQLKKGNYDRGVFLASLPTAGISGWPGHLIRGTQLAYNLGSDEGIPKSIDMFNDKNALGWTKSVTGNLLSIPLTVLELGNGIEGFNNNVLLPTAYTRTLPGYYARTALDLQRNPLTTLKAIGKGDYIHNYSSLRKAVEQARKEIEKGTTHTQNYYQNALKVDIPRPEIDVRTKIDTNDPLGQFNHNTNRTAYKLYKNSTSNLTRKPQEYQFTGGHEGTHYTEQYLYDRYGFPQTSKYVRGDEYFTPNENHPLMYNGRIQEFMKAPGTHGKSPEETWANFLGHKAANIEQPFDEFNMYQEGIQSPYLFIPEMERYIKELSPKALQKEGEIQLFNKVYGNKALGGTISGNSDSVILADNNNYIQDFKGRQTGLPTVRYGNGGHLFGNGGDGRTTLPHVGDSWRNTETDESGTVVGYAPDVPYMGEDGKLYPTTSPVVKYDSGETLFGVTPQYTLPEVTAIGHLRTPADDLDKVMLGTLATGVAPMALPEIVSGATAALANPYVDAALTSYFGAHGINDIANGNANAMTALEVLPMARLAKPLWNAGKSAVNYMSEIAPEVDTFITSPHTGKWATFGNKQYRFKPGNIGMNGVPIESRDLTDFSSTDPSLLRRVFSEYNPYEYKGIKTKGSAPEIKVPEINLDLNNLTTDQFIEYLSQHTGKKIKRVPIKDTKLGKIYTDGYSFIDESGNEIAHIAGTKEGGNVWVESSYIHPDYRYKGLGPQMYYDFNDHVYTQYGTTLHSDPMQRLGFTEQGKSPSNQLWKKFTDEGVSTYEGTGFNRHNVMVEPSKTSPLYRQSTNATQEVSKSQNSASDFDSIFDLSSLYDKSKQIVRAEQEEAMREAEQKVFDYLGSERHIQRIMEGGKSREEAERIAKHMWENAMTAEGELGPLGAAIHGEYDAGLSRIGPWWKGDFKYTLDPKYTINENLFDNAIRRNVFHELGGHGATLSYSPAKSTDPKVQKIYEDVVKEWFPEYKEVYDHNAVLKPVRRPQFENAEEVGLEDGMLHYLEDVDEYSARARAENIEPGGDDFGALYRYFTPESLENLKNNVWGTIPLVLGTGLTGYGLYDNFNSTNSDIHAYGGPIVQHANKFDGGLLLKTNK